MIVSRYYTALYYFILPKYSIFFVQKNWKLPTTTRLFETPPFAAILLIHYPKTFIPTPPFIWQWRVLAQFLVS